MTRAEDNARSKELLLAAINESIEALRSCERKEVVDALIMNRNRVAKFLGEKSNVVRHSKKNKD